MLKNAPVIKIQPIIPLFGVFILDSIGFAIVLPIFANLILNHAEILFPFPLDLSQRFLILGFLLATFPFGQIFGAFIFGHFSDYFGKKQTFTYTLSGIALGYFITAISLENQYYTFLFIGRLVTGFFSANRAICLSTIAKLYSHQAKKKRSYFSKITAIEGASFILAVGLGGFFSDPNLDHVFSAYLPLWIAFILALINLAWMHLSFEDQNLKEKVSSKLSELFSVFSLPHVKIGVFCHFFLVLSWITMLQFNSAFLIMRFDFSLFEITLSYLIVGVFWLLTGLYLYGKIVQKVSKQSLLKWGYLSLSLMMLICFFNPFDELYILMLSLVAIISASMWPATLLIGSKPSEDKNQGKVQGVYLAAKSLALLTGPLFMGYLLYFNINFLHLFTFFTSLAGLFVVLSTRKVSLL